MKRVQSQLLKIRIGKCMIKVLCFILFSLSSVSSFADVVVSSVVDRNKMGEGDTFTLTVTVSSDETVSMQEPQLPAMENFDVINSWTGSESRSTFVNGQFQVKRKQSYNFMLAPQKKGHYNIDSVKVNINGKTFVTKPIKVQVVAGNLTPPPKARGRNRATPKTVDDIFSQFLRRRPRPGFRSQPVDPNESFFIQVEVDKTDVFVGEQVTASFYLYTRAQISDIDTLNYPSLNGFWKEDIEVATRLGFKDEVVNGVVYRKARLASYALFPIKAGAAKIDSYKARCTVVSQNAFGFGRPAKVTKQSKEIIVKVKALPVNTTSSPFVGGVGEYQVSSVLDSKSLPVNQPMTWKIKFYGYGNAKLIDLPKIDLPEGLELYDSKTESSFKKTGKGTKEFELLVIPRKAGSYKLPALSMALFNAETSSYYLVKTKAELLEVQPAEGETSIPSSPLLAGEVEQKKKVSNFPLLALNWDPGLVNLSQAQFFSLWGSAYLLAFMFLFWRAFEELGLKQRKKDVESILRLKFKKVYALEAKQSWRDVGIEVMNAFYYLIGEIAGQGGANQEIEKLMLKVPPSVRRELGAELQGSLKKFEILSFAPEGVVGKLKEKAELKKNVNEMEKLLLKAIKLGLGKQINE